MSHATGLYWESLSKLAERNTIKYISGHFFLFRDLSQIIRLGKFIWATENSLSLLIQSAWRDYWEGEGFVGAKWFSTQHILWLEFLCPIESKVILLFWQLLLAQGCVRRKSWLKQDGLEMRWEDLVLSFMSLHNGWIKVRNLNGWNKIFNKGEMSKNYRMGPEVYLYSFIVSV